MTRPYPVRAIVARNWPSMQTGPSCAFFHERRADGCEATGGALFLRHNHKDFFDATAVSGVCLSRNICATERRARSSHFAIAHFFSRGARDDVARHFECQRNAGLHDRRIGHAG